MRFHVGSVPESPDFTPDATWASLREPTPWRAQLFAMPIGLVTGALIGGGWVFVAPGDYAALSSPLLVLLACLVIIPVHELVHASLHPGAGTSSSSILGFWPSRLVFYAHYLGEVSRCRFVAILLAPLVVLSILPLMACALVGVSSPFVALISTLNAVFACVDILGAGLILAQVPRGATVRNQGWRSYWRIAGDPAREV